MNSLEERMESWSGWTQRGMRGLESIEIRMGTQSTLLIFRTTLTSMIQMGTQSQTKRFSLPMPKEREGQSETKKMRRGKQERIERRERSRLRKKRRSEKRKKKKKKRKKRRGKKKRRD